jgi:uncharacterized protein YndB with AHSA1/START domain
MKRLTTPGKNARSRSPSERPGVIRVARRFGTPPERVFDAWLDPDVAGRWLFATALQPMTDVTIDPRVGGSFRFAQQRDEASNEHTGEYIEIIPHRRLVFTLAVADRPYARTRVTVDITPVKTGCELALTHENVPPAAAHQTEARWTGVLYGLGVTLGASPRQGRPNRRPVVAVDFGPRQTTRGAQRDVRGLTAPRPLRRGPERRRGGAARTGFLLR